MQILEREQHLAAMRQLLDEAREGQGCLLLVGGEAGVGKTTLVDAFCDTVAGNVTPIRSSCDALSTPSPLGSVRAYATALDVPVNATPAASPDRTELFHTFLASLDQRGTTLMIGEDAHWSDEASLDLVRFIGRRIDQLPLLWIVTYRDDEIGLGHPLQRVLGDLATAPGVRRMSLSHLSEASVHQLAQSSGVDPDELFRRTGGNPFFVSEVLATGDRQVPASVSDAVMARAGRLRDSAREVLNTAATIGGRIDTDLLLDMAGPDALDDIDACVAGGLLRVDGDELVFRHQIVRDAIYEAITPPRRRLLHGRALSILQERPDRERYLARLAHHAELSGNMRLTHEFAVAAAEQAVALRAHREAAAQYARALRCAEGRTTEERAELLELWSYECYLTNQLDDAIEGRQRALVLWRDLGKPLRVGDNQRWLSRLYWFAGRNQEAEEAAAAALATLEHYPPGRELAWAFSNKSQLCMLGDDLRGAVEWGTRAIELSECLGEREALVHALNNVGTARICAGDDEGRVQLERSLALALASGMEEHAARAWTNLSSHAVRTMQHAHARRYLSEGIGYTTEHDLDSWRLYMTAWRATMRLATGRWHAAEQDCTLVLNRPNAASITRIVALTAMGRLLARRGDPDAWHQLDDALALAEPTGEVQRLGPTHLARAEAAWLAGDTQRTETEAQAAYALARHTNDGWTLGEATVWLSRIGVPVERPKSIPVPFALELAGDICGAAQAWDRLGCPWHAASVRLRSTDVAEVRSALRTYEQLGAPPAVELASSRLRQLGAGTPRSTTRTHPAGLTAREAEVLALIADGHTNREIADRLYLSPKTVEHHVSAILGKLDVRTRREAVLKAAQHRGVS